MRRPVDPILDAVRGAVAAVHMLGQCIPLGEIVRVVSKVVGAEVEEGAVERIVRGLAGGGLAWVERRGREVVVCPGHVKPGFILGEHGRKSYVRVLGITSPPLPRHRTSRRSPQAPPRRIASS